MTDRPTPDQLRACVEAALPAYLADLERLVNVDCGTFTKAGVDEVGAWAAQRLEELGATVVRHPHAEFGDTLVGTFEGRLGGPTVLLIGHLDTVFDPGTAAARPFTTLEGRAYGPGVSDMKAGLLTGFHALAALRDAARADGTPGERARADSSPAAAWLPVGRLIFVINPDEEIGSPISTPIVSAAAMGADAALVLEAARENGDIVSARKGHLVLRLRFRGRAAHAGVEPEKGRDAVLAAAHAIVAVDRLNGSAPGVTVNAGVVQGGTRANIVAEHAAIEVDVRAARRGDLESVESAIRTVAGAPAVPDVSATVEELSRHWPMEKTTASARLVGLARDVAAQLGFPLADAATGGASDGNTTAGLGVPTIDGLGPIGGQDHGPAEFVEIDSIAPRTALLAGLLVAIGADPELHRRGREP